MLLRRLYLLAAALVLACAGTQTHAYARPLLPESALRACASLGEVAPGSNTCATSSRTEEICPPLRECTSTLGVTGYRKDEDTGLYYAQARWYDPLVGGFNAMDPAFGNVQSPISFNKYVYAAGNPTYYVDPDGREVWNAQLSRINELAYTSSPARESELREEIRVESIRENARLGATLGYFRDTAVGTAEMAFDAARFAAENSDVGRAIGLDIGGRRAVEERSHALGQAALHPINTFIVPIQKKNALAAQLDAQGQTFEAEYVRHQAQLATQDIMLMGAGAVTTARQLMLLPAKLRNMAKVAQPSAPSAAPNVNPPEVMGAGAGVADGVVAGEMASGEIGVKASPSLNDRINARQYTGDKYRDADGKLHHADGRFAEDGAARARKAVEKSQRPAHGNTAGDQNAYLYARYDADSNFLKWGITQDLDGRYTQGELAGGYLDPVQAGPRREILKQERELVETAPGPINFEKWAGKRREQEPVL